MALPVWHEELPQAPLRDGYRGVAGVPFRRTEMEAGRARQIAQASAPVSIECRWRMTSEAFRRFKAFYAGTLRQGTWWFAVPLWFGGSSYVAVPAIFADRYSFAPRAATAVTVSAALRLRELPYTPLGEGVAEGFFDADGRAVWPDALPPAPLREGLTPEPHRPVIETDIEGPKAKRDLFGPSAAAVPVRWSMTATQFELFKGFWVEGIARGNRAFVAPLWYGRTLENVAIRFSAPFAFEPHLADRVLVSGQVEARRLPVTSEGALALLAMMGDGGLATLGTGIHAFVHETWPTAFGEE